MQPSVENKKLGLILTGGGARAAYQIGVLCAIRELLEVKEKNPFPIICGTSAGAINAATLAAYSANFGDSVEHLRKVWGNFHAEQVYRTDVWGVAKSGAAWLSALMFGWIVNQNPRSLLDNAPLRQMLTAQLDFSQIQQSIDRGALHAVSLTASRAC